MAISHLLLHGCNSVVVRSNCLDVSSVAHSTRNCTTQVADGRRASTIRDNTTTCISAAQAAEHIQQCRSPGLRSSQAVRLGTVVQHCGCKSTRCDRGLERYRKAPGGLSGWAAVPAAALPPPQRRWGSSQGRLACAPAALQHRSTAPAAASAEAVCTVLHQCHKQ